MILIGRLTKDPELRYSQAGVAIATFTLAVDRKFKNAQGERETDFIPCVTYRQLAELAANYLSKGKLAAVDGRIQVSSFTGQDGKRRWSTEIVAEDIRFLSPKDSANQGAVGRTADGTVYGHEVSLDDDIPF